MHRIFLGITVASVCLLGTAAQAQWATPTVNGTIAAGEYGTHTNGQNQQTNGGQTWYMTWDDTYLYVAVAGANTAEGVVIYIDHDPIVPVNGGTAANGNVVGQSYDGVNATPPFRADFVCYVKSSYNEYRRRNGSGGWGSATTAAIPQSSSGSNREFRIAWSAITGGGTRPASFNWFGYVVYVTGVYGPVPTPNQSGGMSPPATTYNRRYYTIDDTADGTSTKPFNQISYSYVHTISQINFGTLDVYDFTMNQPGFSITKADSGSQWNVARHFRVDAGTIDCGASTNGTFVTGDVTIGPDGSLLLSSASGGGIEAGGSFVNNGGTFSPNGRSLTLNGSTTKTLAVGQVYNLVVNGTGTVHLGQSLGVENNLTLNGSLLLNGFTLTHTGGTASINSPAAVVTNGGGTLVRPQTGFPYTFHIAPEEGAYNPVTVAVASGSPDEIEASVVNGLSQPGAVDPDGTVDVTWHLNRPTSNAGSFNLTFGWDESQAGSNVTTGSVVAWRYNGATWVNQGGSTIGEGPFETSVTGVTDLSPWAMADPAALPVTVTRFEAE